MADVIDGISSPKPAQVAETEAAYAWQQKRKAAVFDLINPIAGTVQWGLPIAGEGIRGLITRAGKHIAASPEGHAFTDIGQESFSNLVRYRILGEQGYFSVPSAITKEQFWDIMARAKGLASFFVDRMGHQGRVALQPKKLDSLSELRDFMLPMVAP